MRITNSMMINTMMRNLNNNLYRLSQLDNQQATGKKILKPSDDPVGMSQVLKLSSDIATYEQYKSNTDQALSWMEATETSVTQLKDVLQRVRELTGRGATGTLTTEDKQAIEKEISQLKEQVLSIGNANYAGKYLFGGYNTMEKPFSLEETPVGTKLKYNGKLLSPGGIVDDSIKDADFQEFLTNKNNKILTNEQMKDGMKIEIGMEDITEINVNGHELFQRGFGGVFETLTKLEKVLGGEKEYKQGFVDMQYQTDAVTFNSGDLDNSAGDRQIEIKIGKDRFDLKLPTDNPLTEEAVQKSIDAVELLKKNGVKIHLDAGANQISFSAEEAIEVNGTLGSTTINSTNGTGKQYIAPLLVGERLEGTLETTPDNYQFQLEVGGTIKTIQLPLNKKYELNSSAGRSELIKDIEDQIASSAPDLSQEVKISFTEDNRLQFTGKYKDGSAAAFDDIKISNVDPSTFVTKLGYAQDQTSEKAVVKNSELDASAMLGDIDKNLKNVLSILSEIGAKTNRLELDQNRLDDNIINFKKLLSKTQDADMAEVIMELKMQENVYRASLSTGARIIQPTLLDFIR
ncbi:flagellar hook-associated protein FlgL [Clostridiaceae bacterium 35-E11]